MTTFLLVLFATLFLLSYGYCLGTIHQDRDTKAELHLLAMKLARQNVELETERQAYIELAYEHEQVVEDFNRVLDRLDRRDVQGPRFEYAYSEN